MGGDALHLGPERSDPAKPTARDRTRALRGGTSADDLAVAQGSAIDVARISDEPAGHASLAFAVGASIALGIDTVSALGTTCQHDRRGQKNASKLGIGLHQTIC